MKEKKGFAITSMVLGIVSIALTLCSCGLLSYLMIPAAVTGLVLGIISIVQHRAGFGMAVAGVIMCSVGIVLAVICVVVYNLALDSSSKDFMEQWRRIMEQYGYSDNYV